MSTKVPVIAGLEDCEALLIGCGSEKRAERCRAEDLYTSRFFQAKRLFAETSCLPWAILSAQHGVLQPNEWTAPYEKSAEDFSEWERREWAAGVAVQIFGWRRYIRRIAIIAGEPYMHPLAEILTASGVVTVNPCRGLGIGQQVATMRRLIRDAAPVWSGL